MSDQRFQGVHVVGGGLAGSEAAWQIARQGIKVVAFDGVNQATRLTGCRDQVVPPTGGHVRPAGQACQPCRNRV